MPHRRFGFAAGLSTLLLFFTFAAGTARAQVANTTVEVSQTQVGGMSFSLAATVGQLAGTAYERVYAPAVRDFKVSELKWDLEDIAMAGVQGTAEVGRFRVSLGYWAAVTEGDGDMRDRDWLFLDSHSDDDWSHQSLHPDTSLDSGSVLDVNLDVRAFTTGGFTLRGILGYRHDKLEWSSRGGTYQYTWDYNDDGVITPDEYRRPGSFPDGQRVISYRQEYDVPYFGVGGEGMLGPVRLQGHLLYSPWVSAEDHDDHVLRNTTFDGDFSGGDWFGAGASATWFFLPRWFATLSVEYQKFDEMRGDVTENSPEGRFVYGDSGSVELEMVTLLLGAGVRF